MDVLIFQRCAEPLAEAGAGVLPIGRYYKSPYLPRIAVILKTRIIILSDVTWRNNVEHVALISKT